MHNDIRNSVVIKPPYFFFRPINRLSFFAEYLVARENRNNKCIFSSQMHFGERFGEGAAVKGASPLAGITEEEVDAA
jgi:hypothetical protein